jgi:hypothetical protein
LLLVVVVRQRHSQILHLSKDFKVEQVLSVQYQQLEEEEEVLVVELMDLQEVLVVAEELKVTHLLLD